MYKSKAEWRDLTDGHLYLAGEPFPWDGREVPEARLAALSCPQNKAGFAVIELIEEAPKPVVEVPADEAEAEPEQEEAPKAEPVEEKKTTKSTTKGTKSKK